MYIAGVALPESGVSLLGSMGFSEENPPPNTFRLEVRMCDNASHYMHIEVFQTKHSLARARTTSL